MTTHVCSAIERVTRHTGCRRSVDLATGQPTYTVDVIDAKTVQPPPVTTVDMSRFDNAPLMSA